MTTVPSPAAPPPPPPPFAPGDEVGGYHLVRPLSKGGFGQVWIGQHRLLRNYRAVKIVPGGRLAHVELEGVRNYQKLTEPGLLPIWEFGEVPGRGFYYVMPLADDANGAPAPQFQSVGAYEAMTLEKYRQMHRPLPIDRTIAVLSDLLPALQAVHQQGYVHRDIKPDNVVRVAGTWRLCDVGLLVRRDRSAPAGTRLFMVPGAEPDRSTDLYALGVTVYVLASNDPAGTDLADFLAGRTELPGADDRRFGLADLIRKACARPPAERYQTAAEVAAALEPLIRRTLVTVVLEEDFASFGEGRRNELLAGLRGHGFCVCTPPRFAPGSVRATLELPPADAQRLEALVQSGRFGPFRASGAEWGAPAPGFKFRLLVGSAFAPSADLNDLERDLLGPFRAEVARSPGLRIAKEQVPSFVPALGPVWTGAVECAVDSREGLRALCRALWIGVRNLLGRRAEPFELAVETGAGCAKLRSEQLRALADRPGHEAEGIEALLTGAVPVLNQLS
ncbi:MAG TPA: serine/threonine-protein kinase [Gemmata sp.]